MFNDIQVEITQRLSASAALCNKVENGRILDSIEEAYNNTCKGMFFVALYGALEYTLASVVSKTIQEINDQSIGIDRIKPRLLTLSLNPQCDAIYSCGRGSKWQKQHDLFLTFENPPLFAAANTLFPVPPGNIKYQQISFVWEVFGLKAPIVPDPRFQGYFETLADNRMAIAHGRRSPQEVGKNYTRSDLLVYQDSIKQCCFHVLHCFEAYCANRDYVK